MDRNIDLNQGVWTTKEVNCIWKEFENYILLWPCGFAQCDIISTEISTTKTALSSKFKLYNSKKPVHFMPV